MKSDADLTIVDYGVGNLGSLVSMCRKLSIRAALATSVDEVLVAKRIILPGVGAFDHGVEQLRSRGLSDVIRDVGSRGVPILGICLGMQLLAESSAEGSLPGLGLITGRCERFAPMAEKSIRVPHMGWNSIQINRHEPIFPRSRDDWRFYFTHSYHLVGDPSEVVARSEHGIVFAAAVAKHNVMGVQFHPEKSHRFGMELFRHFAGLPC